MKKIILFLILISNQLLIAQNTPWDEETPPISLECANGDVFEISILDLLSNPVVLDSIYSLCGEEGIDEDWIGPGWDDDFWDFDLTDVDNPWEEGFDCINTNPEAFEVYMSCMNGDEEACLYLEEICAEEEEDNEDDEDEEYNCYNEVFPEMDDIDMNTLFGGIEMTYQDIIFIVESSESTISILDENGINYVPEEIDGYLIIGPFTFEDVYTFFIEGLDDFEIDWGMFRPFNSEIISQGTYSSANNNLPEIFNTSAMAVEDLDQELIIYSTDYYDLMGRKVIEPGPNSIYIELKSTNLGPLKDLKYYCN
jgi:hypothetical protein